MTVLLSHSVPSVDKRRCFIFASFLPGVRLRRGYGATSPPSRFSRVGETLLRKHFGGQATFPDSA